MITQAQNAIMSSCEMRDFTEQQKEDDMKGICMMLVMLLLALLAFCATAMDSVNIEADGEVMVMSTGPPSPGVLALGETQICDYQDRIEAIKLMYFIGDAIAAGKDSPTENRYDKNTHNERSGLLRWSIIPDGSGAPLHRWICA